MMRWILLMALVLGGCSGKAPSTPAGPTLTKGSGTIVAGKSVDQVSLGQSRAEVEKTLGGPGEKEINEFNKTQSYALYKDKGLELAYDGETLAMIVCHTDAGWTPYTGATADGLWAGSTKDEIKKALGPPKEDPGQALDYTGLGLWFTFDKDGRVETIKVLPPK